MLLLSLAHKASPTCLRHDRTGPELLPALSLLTTFPCSFFAYLVTAKCLALTPWGAPAAGGGEEELPQPVAAGQRPASYSTAAMAAGAGSTATGR